MVYDWAVPTAHAVAAFVKVGWDETNEPHPLVLRLVDSDGQTVSVPAATGPGQVIEFPGSLEVPRPARMPHGSEIDSTFVINVGPLPLIPGQRYRWELVIDEKTLASEPFLVRSVPDQGKAQ